MTYATSAAARPSPHHCTCPGGRKQTGWGGWVRRWPRGEERGAAKSQACLPY